MTDPSAAEDRLPRTLAEIERGRVDGLHIGAQLYVALRGTTIADIGLGESRPGLAMNSDTRMLWLSSTKPLAAVAIMQLIERGRIGLDDAVCRPIPEFAGGGKEAITLRHLLTHTGGFRTADVGDVETSWDESIARICAMPLEEGWVPGEKAGYHPLTSWYILGELVRRLDGRDFSRYVRDEIFLPLEMPNCWIGMPRAQFNAYGDRIGQMQLTEKPDQLPHPYSSAAGAAVCVPGANGTGPMHELARLYEMFLAHGERNGVRILQPETVDAMTARQRVGMFDETFRHKIDWGLGIIPDSKRYGELVSYGYGRFASERAFGHSGSQSSTAFGDSEHELIVALVFNGMPGERRHQRRMRKTLEAVYEDLGLANVA